MAGSIRMPCDRHARAQVAGWSHGWDAKVAEDLGSRAVRDSDSIQTPLSNPSSTRPWHQVGLVGCKRSRQWSAKPLQPRPLGIDKPGARRFVTQSASDLSHRVWPYKQMG